MKDYRDEAWREPVGWILLIGFAALTAWWSWLVFALWGAPVLIATGLGQSRRRSGWAWGLLLGWLGVFILACMRPWSAQDELAELEAQRQLSSPAMKSFRLKR